MSGFGFGFSENVKCGGDVGYNPISDTDVNLLATGRSALTIPASVGTTPTVLPACLSITHENKKVFVADNGFLDIGSQPFTFCMRVRNDFDYSGYWFWGGKSVAGGKAGMFDFVSYVTTGYIRARVQTTTGLKEIISTQPAVPGTWIFLRMDYDGSKFRFFINETQVGSDLTITGTFPALGNEYEFILGSQNTANGSSFASSAKASYGDRYIFHRILTPTEAATIYAGGIVLGSAAHWPGLGISGMLTTILKYDYDASGNGMHLICDSVGGYEILASDIKFHANGSRHGLNVGYTLYENANNQIYVPLTDAGTEIVSPPGLAGYTRTDNFPGYVSDHNLANSKIAFTGAEWDRSNATYWRALARAASTYYNSASAATKKEWHVIELSNIRLNNWANPDYERKNVVRINDNSYGTRRLLKEIITFSTNKDLSNYDKILTFCNDTNLTRAKTIQLSTTQGAVPINSAIGYIIDSGKSVYLSFGDGYFVKCTSNGTYQASNHTHSSAGTYELRMMGDLDGIGKVVIADQLANVNISEFGKAINIWWLGSGITRTLIGNMDDLPSGFKEIWFRYPTIDGEGINGNLDLKPLLEAFEMQGGTATPSQYFVKNVTGNFANIRKMKNWCCVSKVGGDVTLFEAIEYFSWADFYQLATIFGNISGHVYLWSYETQVGGESVVCDTTQLINMEQLKGNMQMVLPPNLNHMPKLSVFQPFQQVSEPLVNTYLANIKANRDVARVHLLNTIASGIGYRHIDLSVHASSEAPTGQGLIDKPFLQTTVSPSVPGDGSVWVIDTK